MSQECVDILLLDFDKTLTKQHTSGALNFLRINHKVYREDFPTQHNAILAHNVACNDPVLLFNYLLKWVHVDKKCVAVVTMADERFEAMRAATLSADEKKAYEAVGGRRLVLRWLVAIAGEWVLANDNKVDQTTQTIDICAVKEVAALFETKRFQVYAKYNESSKQWHIMQALQNFDHDSRQKIVYYDDSLPLVYDATKLAHRKHLDMKAHHCPAGLTSDLLRQIDNQVQSQ